MTEFLRLESFFNDHNPEQRQPRLLWGLLLNSLKARGGQKKGARMRRIAKLSLLLAPLCMASVSGCATPQTTSQNAPVDTQEARLGRMMAVAAEYEKSGKPEAAMRLYDHVLAQQPTNTDARERRNLLTQQGIKSNDRSLKPALSPTQPATSLASTQPSRPAASPQLEELTGTNSEDRNRKANLAELLAEKQTAQKAANEAASVPEQTTLAERSPSNPLADHLSTATEAPIPNMTPGVHSSESNRIVEIQSETPQTDSPGMEVRESTEETPSLVAKASPFEDNAVKPDDAAKPDDAWAKSSSTSSKTAMVVSPAVPDESDSGWSIVDPGQERVKLASNSHSPFENNHKPAEEKLAELTRAVADKPAPVSPANDGWQKTRIADLCESLSPELAPCLTKLEDPNPAERVKGLLKLGEHREEAQSASVAVYSMMEDPEPIVAVYAAGTLRQITGDAWSSVHTLTRYLDHQNQDVAQLAAYFLGQMGPEAMDAVPTLEKIRDVGQGMTSLYAAEALTHIAPGDKNSVTALTTALSEANPELRWFAAVSLGTVAGDCEQQAVEGLRKALRDKAPDVRIAACLSLGGLGANAQAAIPDLEQAVRSDAPEVKSAAETALACLRG